MGGGHVLYFLTLQPDVLSYLADPAAFGYMRFASDGICY